MKPYYLELDWDSSQIQAETYDYCRQVGFVDSEIKHQFIPVDPKGLLAAAPALAEFFNLAGYRVISTSFYILEDLQGNLHVDRYDYLKMARINFPVLNCSNTVTEFYKIRKGSLKYHIQDNGVTYYSCEDPKPKFVTGFTLNKPTVINVLEPHRVRVINPGIRRISLTVAVDPNPVDLLF